MSRESLRPIPWRDFVVGFNVASQTLEPTEGADAVTSSGTERERDPFTRVLTSARDHFGPDYEHLTSFIHRFWALIELVHAGHAKDWLSAPEPDSSGNRTLHPALLLAAAEVKLTRNARFPVRRFLARVEDIVRTEGGGE